MLPIAINRHQFLSLNSLDKYIYSLPNVKKQLSAEQQGLEFCVTYTSTIMENASPFAKKLENKDSWKASGYSDKNMNKLIKPIRDHNVTY